MGRPWSRPLKLVQQIQELIRVDDPCTFLAALAAMVPPKLPLLTSITVLRVVPP